MKLIIGLGNPGKQYEQTRHNLGFIVLDEIARGNNTDFKDIPKHNGQIASFDHKGDKVLLLKPNTYYNEAGRAARAVIDFYKIPTEDVLIIHDELMLPFGRLRTRIGGSDAGNNGIKSLNSHLGTNTKRLRIGIYNELRDQMNDADFVLSKFSKTEAEKLPAIITKAVSIANTFINASFETTTQ